MPKKPRWWSMVKRLGVRFGAPGLAGVCPNWSLLCGISGWMCSGLTDAILCNTLELARLHSLCAGSKFWGSMRELSRALLRPFGRKA
eukprot:3073091-Amphidinium_carterae.1